QVVLNQDSRSLAALQATMRAWKRGVGTKKNDLVFSRFRVGSRMFVLAFHFAKTALTEDEWMTRSRTIALNGARMIFEASDCAVFLRVKKSKEATFDAV